MSIPSGIRISDECIAAVHALHSPKRCPNKLRFVIFKVDDDQQSVVVEASSSEPDYETFRQMLCDASDHKTTSLAPPRYAVYDVDYDLGQEGKRTKSIFISWIPVHTPLKLCMVYASTREYLRKALNIEVSIHADSIDELEWESILEKVSSGRA
ncbi:cofilin, actophorin [Aaosphaeria arxii CBS 175.79]|uniref:Cofilin n=1 Tax=Aaosphaeria arxii CBS 175.79 TaxID=1450172 RepID=A0A6A5Y2L1_9PLEO|nr:cofilin, actophorin [Aaosphaeria arxii CBS 175.79]KAF2019489.1 cofilin, actophorin [Aaosphaeria arxii CBS 175.79]